MLFYHLSVAFLASHFTICSKVQNSKNLGFLLHHSCKNSLWKVHLEGNRTLEKAIASASQGVPHLQIRLSMSCKHAGLLQKVSGHTPQSFLRPFHEPILSTRWELQESCDPMWSLLCYSSLACPALMPVPLGVFEPSTMVQQLTIAGNIRTRRRKAFHCYEYQPEKQLRSVATDSLSDFKTQTNCPSRASSSNL